MGIGAGRGNRKIDEATKAKIVAARDAIMAEGTTYGVYAILAERFGVTYGTIRNVFKEKEARTS